LKLAGKAPSMRRAAKEAAMADEDEDKIVDAMLRNYRDLTPAEQSEFQRRVLARAKVKRAEAIRGVVRAVVLWFRRRAAVARLQRLDDRMLKDIGITRGEIDQAVRGCDVAYRRSTPKSASVRSCGQAPSMTEPQAPRKIAA
jgi:uncharacterized protein YjiS (DUF1127 family)